MIPKPLLTQRTAGIDRPYGNSAGDALWGLTLLEVVSSPPHWLNQSPRPARLLAGSLLASISITLLNRNNGPSFCHSNLDAIIQERNSLRNTKVPNLLADLKIPKQPDHHHVSLDQDLSTDTHDFLRHNLSRRYG